MIKSLNVYVNGARKYQCWLKLVEHNALKEGNSKKREIDSYYLEFEKAECVPKAADILELSQDDLDENCRSNN